MEERMQLKKAGLEEKEEALNFNKNLEKTLLKKLQWLEDGNLRKQTGRSMKYANTKLPADPCYLLRPKSMNLTHCITIIALGASIV